MSLAFTRSILVLALLLAPVCGQSVVNAWSTGTSFPGGLDYDPSTDTIWVVDSTADSILQFDRTGVLLQSWIAPPPPGSTALTATPIGCALDPATGNLWVADEAEWCYELDPTGTWTGLGFSTLPAVADVSGAAWDATSGTIWISQDTGTRSAVEFDVNGVVLQTIVLTGAGSTDPDGLGFHSGTGHLFLGEDTGDQILETDPAGVLVNAWQLAGLGISPEGIGLDEANGRLFVADGFGGTVWELDGILGWADLLGAPGQVSIGAGGIQTLSLDAGVAHAGMTYLLLGTEVGASPGIPIDGVHLNLNIGPYLIHTLTYPNQQPLTNSFATLDSSGKATALFSLPSLALNPAFAGAKLHHAYLLFQPTSGLSVVYGSAAAELLLIP